MQYIGGFGMESVDSVLVVDDDAAVRRVLAALLGQAGLRVLAAATAEEALALLEQKPVDAVVSDLRMPGIGGMELLSHVVQRWPDIPVVLLTAHGTVPLAVEAMRNGAADFMLKPFEREEVLFVVKKALLGARRGVPPSTGDKGLVGQSACMSELHGMLRRAAASTATVLIRGETGTGKELVARAIHEQSARRTGPFVRLHCAALPDALLESELFGHEKGAFTGAVARKPGRVELAAGGTLFLDEIGDVPPATQVKLLRVLQEREFERLGGVVTLKVDVRFVAATHRDLEALIEAGEFRQDLFYRLNVIPLEVPPLRARTGDIERLVQHFVTVSAVSNQKPGARLDASAVVRLAAEPWPGNVRQLENFVERLVVLSDAPHITLVDVERELAREAARARPQRSGALPTATTGSPLEDQRRDLERSLVLSALEKAGNNRTRAARILGVSRRTLYNKLEEFGVA